MVAPSGLLWSLSLLGATLVAAFSRIVVVVAIVIVVVIVAGTHPGLVASSALQTPLVQECSEDIALFCRTFSVNFTILRDLINPRSAGTGEITNLPIQFVDGGILVQNAALFDSYRTGEAYLISSGSDNLPLEKEPPLIIALQQESHDNSIRSSSSGGGGGGGIARLNDGAVFFGKRHGPTLARSAVVKYVACGAGSVRFDALGLAPPAWPSSAPNESHSNLTVLATYVQADDEPYYCGTSRARALAGDAVRTAHIHISRTPRPGREDLWSNGVYGIRIIYLRDEDTRRRCSVAANNIVGEHVATDIEHTSTSESQSGSTPTSGAAPHICGAALGIISVEFLC